MRKRLSTNEILEVLAAYALRAISPDEADDVERELATMTSEELNLLSDYESVVGLLGYVVTPVEPPASLESTIMTKISEEVSTVQDSSLFSFVGTEDGAWHKLFDGISVKFLSEDLKNKTRTALLDMKAGSVLPRHLHKGREEVYCLEGYCTLNGQHVQKGDYLIAESGSIHEAVVFEVDCRIIAVLPEIEFLV